MYTLVYKTLDGTHTSHIEHYDLALQAYLALFACGKGIIYLELSRGAEIIRKWEPRDL